MTNVTLNVEGMTCGHCKASVTNALTAVTGVETVEVSLEAKTATVSFNEDAVKVEALKDVIEEQGFDVK